MCLCGCEHTRVSVCPACVCVCWAGRKGNWLHGRPACAQLRGSPGRSCFTSCFCGRTRVAHELRGVRRRERRGPSLEVKGTARFLPRRPRTAGDTRTISACRDTRGDVARRAQGTPGPHQCAGWRQKSCGRRHREPVHRARPSRVPPRRGSPGLSPGKDAAPCTSSSPTARARRPGRNCFKCPYVAFPWSACGFAT